MQYLKMVRQTLKIFWKIILKVCLIILGHYAQSIKPKLLKDIKAIRRKIKNSCKKTNKTKKQKKQRQVMKCSFRNLCWAYFYHFCWFSLNNSETLRAVTLEFCSIQQRFIRNIRAKISINNSSQSADTR